MGNISSYTDYNHNSSSLSAKISEPNAPEFYLNTNVFTQGSLSSKEIMAQILDFSSSISISNGFNTNHTGSCKEEKEEKIKDISMADVKPMEQEASVMEDLNHKEKEYSIDHDHESIQLENSQVIETIAGSLLKDIRQVYKFKEVLGEGHFGTVRVGFRREENPKRHFAIKSISKKNLSEKDLGDLIKEVDIISSLDHPNIIKFYETYHDQYYFHIVMEYCRGKEVFSRILEEGVIVERKVIMVIIKVLHAISYCHSRGVTHRDLKPENILFESTDADAEIKLIDFGLSRKYSNNEKMHTILGTPYYIAPEVLKGDYNEKCDIWSIGAVSYVMLCGDPPFKGNASTEIFNKILKEDVKFDSRKWRNISSTAQDFIRMCMSKNTDNRPSAIEALKHPWFHSVLHEVHDDLYLSMRILNNLKEFNSFQRFKRMILRYIVNMRTRKELKKYKAAFYAMDFNHMGSIGLDDLEKAFEIAKVDINPEAIKRLLFVSDNPSNKRIDYTEFLLASINKKKYITKEQLRAAFHYFDVNNSNLIEEDDLRDSLLRFGKRVIHSEDVNKIILDVMNSHKNQNSISLEDLLTLFDIDESHDEHV